MSKENVYGLSTLLDLRLAILQDGDYRVKRVAQFHRTLEESYPIVEGARLLNESNYFQTLPPLNFYEFINNTAGAKIISWLTGYCIREGLIDKVEMQS